MPADGSYRCEAAFRRPGSHRYRIAWASRASSQQAAGLYGQNPGVKSTDAARVLTSEGVSNFGAMLSRLTIPWIATLALRATPMQMAALLIVDVAAAGLASLALGSWIDRSGKRMVMLAADGTRFALLGALALAVWSGFASYVLLLAVAAANGVLTIGFELARSAWMAQRVSSADLPRRNAQLSVVGSLSEAAAFALGGWLFQWLGAVLALALDSLSYVISAACLGGVQEVAASHTRPTTAVGWRAAAEQVSSGARVVWTIRALRALGGIEALLAFSMALTGTTYMIYVSRDIGLPTGVLGLIFATGGLGAVAGAATAPWLGRRYGSGKTMFAALAILCLGAAFIPLAQGASWGAVALLTAHQIIGDAGHAAYSVHDRTIRQTAVPVELLARADAGIRGAGQLATLAGAVVGGFAGAVLGARGVLWLAIVPIAVAVVLAAGRLDASPLRERE
jgi:MFS family permease